MADELRIKIILDDGSVKEGFVSAEKQADKSTQKIGNSFDKKGAGLQNLEDGAEAAAGGISGMAQAAIRAAGPVGSLAAGVAAVAAAGFKMALAGEQVNAVNIQFANVAKSAGLAADQFGESIINATQGLIDDEDALQIATKGIVALGDQASKLPAILDASRGVSRALGKDFKETFQDLSTFVENGNAKVLRNYGIVLDLDKAYAKAAKSIGLTSAQLNEQQKQQIRANLILDEVPKKFDAAAKSVTPLKDAYDKFSVTAGNAFDNSAKTINTIFAPAIKTALDGLNSFFSKLNEVSGYTALESANSKLAAFNTTVLEGKIKIPLINKELETLNQRLLTTSSVGEKVQLNTQIQRLQSQVERLASSSKIATEEIQKLGGIRINPEEAPAGKNNTKKTDAELKADRDQLTLIAAERIKKEEEYTAFLLSEQAKRINNTIQIKQIELANEKSTDQQTILNKQILDQQLLLQENNNQSALNGLKKQFAGTELIDVQNKNAAIEENEKTHKENLALINKNAEKVALADQEKMAKLKLSSTSQFFGNLATLQESSSAEMANLGRNAALAQAVIDGYASIVGAYKNGAIIGGPVLGATYAAAAAVATGVQIAKISSAGGGGSSYSPDTGGGIASSPSMSTDLTPTQDLQRAEASTGVSVVIQGDVLDSDESGSRIVNLINSAFDKKGVVINQGVMA